MEIKPDRLMQCALWNKCPKDLFHTQEYLYVDVISVGKVDSPPVLEIFITRLKDWKTDVVRYWTDPKEVNDYVKLITHSWEVVEGKLEE